MLEQANWIAGIVAGIVAVLGLFLWRRKKSASISQNARVSGQSNTVKQRANYKNGKVDGD